MVKRIAKEVQIFHHLHQRRIEEETPKENDHRKKKIPIWCMLLKRIKSRIKE